MIHNRVHRCFDGSRPNDHGGTYCDDCGAKVAMEDISPPENVMNLSVHRMMKRLSESWCVSKERLKPLAALLKTAV